MFVKLVTGIVVGLCATMAHAQFDTVSIGKAKLDSKKPDMRAGAPTTLPVEVDPARTTTDRKYAFPVADEKKKVDLQVPSIGAALGALPEEVSPKVFYLWDKGPQTATWRKMLDKYKVDYRGFDWVAPAKGDANLMVFALSQGRVVRVGYLFPTLTLEKAEVLIEPIRSLADEQGTIEVSTSITGERIEVIKGDFHPGIIGQSSGWREPDTTRTHPAFVSAAIDEFDWLLAHADMDKETKAALRAGIIKIGMNRDHCVIARRGFLREYSAAAGGIETITFYTWRGYYHSEVTLRDGKVTSVSGNSGPQGPSE